MIDRFFTFISASINASLSWAETLYGRFGISFFLLVFVLFFMAGVKRYFLSQML